MSKAYYWRPDKYGKVSKCSCPEDLVGKGRCIHLPGHTYPGLSKEEVEMKCLELLSELTENHKTRDNHHIILTKSEQIPQDVEHGLELKFKHKRTRAYCKVDNAAECKTSALSEELSDITFQYCQNMFYHAKYTTRAYYSGDGKDTGLNCCVSKNFLFKGENVLTFEEILTEEEYTEFKQMEDPSDQFDYLCNKIKESTDVDIHTYLIHQFVSDLLISNPDGHLRNLAVVKKTSKFKMKDKSWVYGDTFRQCPYFDHGLALFANYKKFPLDAPIEENLFKVRFRPFGVWKDIHVFKSCEGLTREQMTELLKKKIRPSEKLQINVKALKRRLSQYTNDLYEEKYVKRSVQAILSGLEILDKDLWVDISK